MRLLFVLFFVSLFVSCSDPKDIKIPSDLSSWEDNTKIKDAIGKLSEEDQQLFVAYILRKAISSVFTGDDSVSYYTIGDAINLEREYQEEAIREAERQEILRKDIERKQLEAIKIMNEALTTSLVKLSFHKSNWELGSYSDFFDIRIGYKNNTDKDIAGVKGKVIFKDIFGEVIKAIRLSDDDGVKAGATRTYRGSINYNQFMDEDKKLRSTDFSKLKFEWEPIIYLFEDGTSLKMPGEE